jgi:glutathione S-transferase
LEKIMSDLTLLGFPRSTFAQIVGLVLTHKDLPYKFRDLEPDMGSPVHLALHPFDRVPILQHRDVTLYETSAIGAYLERGVSDAAAAARDRPGPRADEPVDQCGQFLLLPVHV